ncbi:hypothetical protein [Pseudarthrobacter sp. YAF2]|uniref:hypothetical protein n=1 Tax=Pseudarthrobacter sp. YAF2 TaxID=3233078 RepID=UPI003F9E1A7B
MLWSKSAGNAKSPPARLSLFESTPQAPPRARTTIGLRNQVVDAVIRSGRPVAETAAGFAVSWWMVRAAVTEACLLQLPDADKLSTRMRMLGMDTGQVLGMVDGRDHKGRGGLAVRPTAGMAAGRAGRGNRPFRGVQEGVTDVASTDGSRS